MSVAAPVMPTTEVKFDLARVHQQILFPRYSRLLYNPSDEPVEFTIAARTFVIPPRGKMADKEVWLVGQCPIADGYTKERREWFAAQEYPPEALPGCLPLAAFYGSKRVIGVNGQTVYEILPAEDQARTLTGLQGGDGPVSKLGVRLLSGDPELDAAIKADADAAWKEAAYLQDIMLVRSHEQINAKMTELGNPLRPPSVRVKKAMIRKMEYERAGKVARLYECPVCADPHSTVHERDTHIVTFHPERAGSMGLGLGHTFDAQGNPVTVDVAARYAQGASGTVHGYREVTRDPQTGEIVSEKWVGETPEEFETRMASRSSMQQRATAAAADGAMDAVLETIAAMQAKIDELAAQNDAASKARAAGAESSRVRRPKPQPQAEKE